MRMGRLALSAWLFSAFVVVGCAHGAPWERLDDPPLAVTLSVKGLKKEEKALLRDQLCALPAVEGCALEEKKGEAVYRFTYRGSLGRLRWQIARFPHPGLDPKDASVGLTFQGYDNLAPTIVVQGPQEGEVLTDTTAVVVVQVADPDTAAVKVGGRDAALQGEGRYAARVDLVEGDNRVEVTALDDAGNESKATVAVLVDTTPPELEVEVKVLSFDKSVVSGKVKGAARVVLDGKEVPLDLFGAFSAEIAVDPDKQRVVVEAVDAHGNARTVRRVLTRPSGPSADSD